jgi:hypothetical protein
MTRNVVPKDWRRLCFTGGHCSKDPMGFFVGAPFGRGTKSAIV